MVRKSLTIDHDIAEVKSNNWNDKRTRTKQGDNRRGLKVMRRCYSLQRRKGKLENLLHNHKYFGQISIFCSHELQLGSKICKHSFFIFYNSIIGEIRIWSLDVSVGNTRKCQQSCTWIGMWAHDLNCSGIISSFGDNCTFWSVILEVCNQFCSY